MEAAAEIFGTSSAAVSTVLQGFYQSHQATAASVAVNNMHLVRGMLGRPGAGILQMNGQPTAQNNRETGADGDLPGFRNWQNAQHTAELAELGGTSIRLSSPTGLSRLTRCRFAMSNRARSTSCGSPAPTQRYHCPSSAGFARSQARSRSSWS